MSSSPSAPQPPDPMATAAAQSRMNRDTAITQFGLNATNQVTPGGSLNYRQIGTWDDGTPRFEAVTNLSAPERAVYDTDVANRQKLGTVGGQQIDRVSELLSRPFQLNNDATENRLLELGSKRLSPFLTQRRQALETDLANKGITMGSEAYDKAINLNTQGDNDAWNQLLLTGRGQAVNELMTERNQPLNEILALIGGSQVQGPNFAQTPSTAVAPVDYTGMVQSNANLEQRRYEADVSRQNAMLGGLFGLAAAPLTGRSYSGFRNPFSPRSASLGA